jgi:transglutaminase-like putative cysteine protease/uncharacterized protein (DUF58 family)
MMPEARTKSASISAKPGWLDRLRAFITQSPQGYRTTVQATLHTLSWVALTGTMLYAGAAQANGAAYLLAFLTGALGIVSYVYAKANLRGLEVRVGAAPVVRAGEGEVLMVELRAASGHSPCGIEVILVGAAKATFVEQIPSGQSVRLHLRLPSVSGPLRLLLRSAYPLGLLRAQRQVNVELTRYAIPEATGSLPLPEIRTSHEGEGGKSGGGKLSRDGDDFAGVREWHMGDSPRHIDWRAVARGRPLMVKTWARNSGDSVHLEWQNMSIAESERPGQMVRWVQTCEQQGISYSLSLPGGEIPVGQGESHARRCLTAIAELYAGALSVKNPQKNVRVPASHEYTAGVPRGPLALLSAVLFITVLPLQSVIPMPVLILLFLSLSYRNILKKPLLSRWLPLLFAVVGIAGIVFTQGELFTTEAGIAVLVVLAGGKMLESRTPHDFQVIAMVGWFLCLCGLMMDQGISRSVLMFTSYALIAGCMVRFRRGTPGVKQPAALVGKLILQTLPLVVLLFLVFPRWDMGSFFRMGGGSKATTGVPTSLDPGRILQIAKSTETAFRVQFPDDNIPPNNKRYWRCVVLWDCQGLSWNRGLSSSYEPKVRGQEPGDIQQIITLEPHGQSWLPSLDYPIHGVDGRGVSMERLLSSYERVRKTRRYDVLSRPELVWEEMPDSHRRAALEVPNNVSPALRQIAQSWRQSAATDEGIAEAGLDYLRKNGFEYTLEPGSYLGTNALEDFFVRRKIGFCEHFSAAYATLLRVAGVPTRVVMGYLGGEMSMTGTHLIVRQSDAHSWVEVWLEGKGWTRIDPTAALAPGRAEFDLRSYLMGGEEALEEQRNSWLWRWTEQTRLLWDQVNYQWYNFVVSFDDELQFGWMSQLGLTSLKGHGYQFIASLGLVGLLLVALTLWLRRAPKHSDPWRRAWGKLCQRLENRGIPAQRGSEGALAYAERVGDSLPEILPLAQQYAKGRYGSDKDSLRSFKQAVKELPSR